ncbi:hypothetical protein DXG01_010976 [Tephrocybe rancida]|nr:hypothetical protein DXG01_010976 [Tephrocybe rancida]
MSPGNTSSSAPDRSKGGRTNAIIRPVKRAVAATRRRLSTNLWSQASQSSSATPKRPTREKHGARGSHAAFTMWVKANMNRWVIILGKDTGNGSLKAPFRAHRIMPGRQGLGGAPNVPSIGTKPIRKPVDTKEKKDKDDKKKDPKKPKGPKATA